MRIKFKYLDDEERDLVEPFALALSNKELGVVVEFENPKEYSEQMDELKQGGFDGLILDWRLDLIPVIDGKSVKYRASTIAQEMRSIASEKHELEIPIVLLSTFDKLQQSYERDETSHDLFDRIYIKEKVGEEAQSISAELCALVNGYHRIIAARNSRVPLYQLLGLQEQYANVLDVRMQEIFPEDDPKPAHKYALFILKELIDVSGPLIDEFVMAARLGIDIEQSKDWEHLKGEVLSSCAYKGPFGEAWPRWWGILLDQWWGTLEGVTEPLPFLNAAIRVEILKKNTQLGALQAAKPFEQGYSSKFWTICQARKRPLDPMNGFMIQSREQYPWQERQYVSKIAALHREKFSEGLKIHVLEKENYFDYVEEMELREDGQKAES